MKYEKMIQSILEEVGGQENIENVYHCATRLRFQLKDETKANDEAVKAIDGVLSIVKGGEFVIFPSIWYEGCSMVEIETESLGNRAARSRRL